MLKLFTQVINKTNKKGNVHNYIVYKPFTAFSRCNHSVYIGGRKILRNHYTKDLNHDMSSEEYMRTRLMKKNCLVLGNNELDASKKWINNGGCSS